MSPRGGLAVGGPARPPRGGLPSSPPAAPASFFTARTDELSLPRLRGAAPRPRHRAPVCQPLHWFCAPSTPSGLQQPAPRHPTRFSWHGLAKGPQQLFPERPGPGAACLLPRGTSTGAGVHSQSNFSGVRLAGRQELPAASGEGQPASGCPVPGHAGSGPWAQAATARSPRFLRS